MAGAMDGTCPMTRGWGWAFAFFNRIKIEA